MIGDAIRKVFSSKVFYVVFSLLLAVVLWIFVEINENQSIRHTIEGVPVVYVNEDIFRDRNLVIASPPQTVTLTFDCSRNIASRLKNSTVTAAVDLQNIKTNGSYLMSYTIVYPQGVTSNDISRTTRSVTNITLSVDILHERQIPVEVFYNGGTSSADFVAESPEFSPQTITVFGPEAVISKIVKARVPIIRENLSTTYTEDLPFILIDEDDNELAESRYEALTFDRDTVRVTVPISLIKDVALHIELVYGAGATPQNTIVTIDPPTISISGDPDAISDYNTIVLGTIDTTRFDSAYADNFQIAIQNNFTNVSNVTEALVTVEVRGLEIRHLSVTNLHVVNTPRELEATIITQSVDVKLRGSREDLERLNNDDPESTETPLSIWVTADLSDYSAGTAAVPARVRFDGEAGEMGAIGDCRITVRLVKT